MKQDTITITHWHITYDDILNGKRRTIHFPENARERDGLMEFYNASCLSPSVMQVDTIRYTVGYLQKHNIPYKIISTVDELEFDTIKDCAKYYDINPSVVSVALSKPLVENKRGLIYIYDEEKYKTKE